MTLHNLALSGIVFTKSLFFDKNPAGRMLNRFSKDLSLMDETLINVMKDITVYATLILGNFIVIIIVAPFNLIVVAVVIAYFYVLVLYFSRTIKDIKSLELTSKSPILTILNSSVHGLATIRCLDLQKKMLEDMNESIKTNMKASLSYRITLRTLQLYLEFILSVLNTANIVILVLMKDSIDPGLVGLSIALGTSLLTYFSHICKLIIDMDTYMASPQRLFEYANLESEGKLIESGTFKITHGKIQVINLYMKYRENYDYALKNLSFTIESGTKAGIIGRTGAGKSSIMQTLFRLVNPEKGFILIDGQDFMHAGLHELRRQMSVIPQSAILFVASLRDNLDPFHEHTDEVLIKVLKKLRFGSILAELPNGLDSRISSKGLSLSAGQKQLLCLARAVLRKNKIVMIDEATANIDSETDEFIQLQLRKKFKNCTVLIIAHRLRTVIESDWIVVMDEGSAKEEGHPKELIKNEGSLLMKMIMHTGPEESRYLLSKLN